MLSGLRPRLAASLDRAGIAIPWWLPMPLTGVSTVLAIAAVVQRDALFPPTPIALAAPLAVATAAGWSVTGVIAPSWLKALTVIGAVAILLTQPVVPDFAPILLALLVTEMATVTRPAFALTVAGLCVALLGAAEASVGLVGWPVYLAAIPLSHSGGLMLRWYVRALEAERNARESAREQAVLAERQRIAREVHDVVAHSLSTTLLHLTGVRHALQHDRDIDEAVDGLTEAEQVGRTAMADIRRTVALFARGPSDAHPLPDARDISELIELTRAAGLDVHYELRGDPGSVTDLAGLGLYRIAQESLANIVKHAPHATARIRLIVDATGARLTVHNSLPDPTSGATSGGSGLTGMATRAAQLGGELRAGPQGADWVVDVLVPNAYSVVAEPPTATGRGAPQGAP